MPASAILPGWARLDPARLTVLASWGARLLSAAAQIVTIPILVRWMGRDVYGIYVVTISLYAWYLLADLGIGYALQNRISTKRANAAAPDDEIVSDVAGLLLSLPLILIVAAAIGAAVGHLLWTPAQQALADGPTLLAISAIAFVLVAFGNLSYRILYAQQRGYLANLLQGAASLASLLLVIAGSRHAFTANVQLLAMVLSFAGPQALLAIGMLARAFERAHAAGGRVRLATFPQTVRESGGFLAFGFLSLVTLQVDYMVLISAVPPSEIVKYNVIAKVLGLGLVLFQAMLQAHWPSCAEAASRHDWTAIRTRLAGLIRRGALLVLGLGAAYALFEDRIMQVVSPRSPATLGLGIVAVYVVYLLTRIWSDSYAMVLQSMGRMKIFVIYVPVQAALSLGLQVVLARTFGVAGLIAGLLASFLLTSCWVLPLQLRRLQRSSTPLSSPLP